jgi:hypothetical protein
MSSVIPTQHLSFRLQSGAAIQWLHSEKETARSKESPRES